MHQDCQGDGGPVLLHAQDPSLGHPGTHRHELGQGLWWSGSDQCHRPGGHLHPTPSIGQLVNSNAGIIPVPDLERFNPKPPFGNNMSYTWGLVHGTTVSAATYILLEGLNRPADWDHHKDSKMSAFPNFGLFAMGQQMANRDTELPRWLVTDLTDPAAKRGKGQQPILVGAIYRGKYAHAAFKAGGNDRVQLKVAQRGVATSNEKYTVAHSANTQVRFIAVTWLATGDLHMSQVNSGILNTL